MFSTYISVVASLFIVEVLLSIDNALVNATLAEALPEDTRIRAIRLGIIFGAVFRFVALFAATIIIHNAWLKIIGALYLIYLAVEHLGKVINESGYTHTTKTTFRGVVTQIALADIVFSIDNVISAVSFSSNTYLVMFGVLIGVISMLFITPILSRLIHRYKGMPQAAYAIVGLIGVALLFETVFNIHITELTKFIMILCIIGFTVWYEHSFQLRKMSNPILKKMQYIIAIPLDLVYATKNLLKMIAKK